MRIIFFLSLILMLAMPAANADYDSATAAYNSGDRSASFMEFNRLAAQGHVKAQFMLANQYLNGQGVLQDFVQAHQWFNLAASAGHPLAGEYRDRTASRMTRTQIAEAQQLARQWRPDTVEDSSQDSAASNTLAQNQNQNQSQHNHPGNTVARIQHLLNQHGYEAGPADGKMGRKTREAIRRYQADTGLFQDGEASASLLTFMEAQFPQDNTTTDTPAPAPAPASAATSPASATGAQADPKLAQLVTELQKLIKQAERSRTADSRFLDQLRDLADRYAQSTSRRQLLLNERFSNEKYVRNTSWEIISGKFFLTRGEGLHSNVAVAQASANRKKSNKELAINILGSILNSQQGGSSTNTTSTASKQAEIHIPKNISNRFSLRLVINARSVTEGALFNLYQGFGRQAGYRLAYAPGQPNVLQLLRVSSRGSTLIASDDRYGGFDDGADHTLLWSRDSRGVMRVSIDGRERLRVTDSGYRDDFDGFSFINRGGDYTLRELRIYATR